MSLKKHDFCEQSHRTVTSDSTEAYAEKQEMFSQTERKHSLSNIFIADNARHGDLINIPLKSHELASLDDMYVSFDNNETGDLIHALRDIPESLKQTRIYAFFVGVTYTSIQHLISSESYEDLSCQDISFDDIAFLKNEFNEVLCGSDPQYNIFM